MEGIAEFLFSCVSEFKFGQRKCITLVVEKTLAAALLLLKIRKLNNNK
jgi:hypothetical protein